MKPSMISILSIPLLAAGAIALSGCGKGSSEPTTITYHQVGICKNYEMHGVPQEAKADEGFVVFKIESIENSKSADLLNFDPTRLYVNQSKPEDIGNLYRQNRRFINPDQKVGSALGVKYVASTAIPSGGKLEDVGYLLIPLALNNPTGSPEANNYNFAMTYDTGTGERGDFTSEAVGMHIVKTNPPDTKYTVIENCKELPFK